MMHFPKQKKKFYAHKLPLLSHATTDVVLKSTLFETTGEIYLFTRSMIPSTTYIN